MHDVSWPSRAKADFEAAGIEVETAGLVVVALCEVTNSVPRNPGPYFVVPQSDDVAVRYLLLVGKDNGARATPVTASTVRWGDAPLAQHMQALLAEAAAATETRRDEMRAVRRAAVEATAAEAAPAAALDAALDAATARFEAGTAGGAAGGAAGASATAARAVAKELRELGRAARSLSLDVSLPDENNVFRWRVLMRDWEDCAPLLADDLKAYAAANADKKGARLHARVRTARPRCVVLCFHFRAFATPMFCSPARPVISPRISSCPLQHTHARRRARG
jgi:hypothetical protein